MDGPQHTSLIHYIGRFFLSIRPSVFKPLLAFREQLGLPFHQGDSPLDFIADPARQRLGLNTEVVATRVVTQWTRRTRVSLLNGEWWPTYIALIQTMIQQCHHPSLKVVAELATLDLSQLCERMPDPQAHHYLHTRLGMRSGLFDDIVKWLKACPDPPLEVISFWEQQAVGIHRCIRNLEGEMGFTDDTNSLIRKFDYYS
ncbi:hypothetical protein B0H16DRAFT_1692407 [Mycena metata]|uniref:Uncharacterized protein n=1 Tax=Mycena metata TaxID=1033252 RepID=A0AAD7IQP4_9AGAR|nr:hypothetical protein B0H16DRAFT_1692407 [Mycena metata]